MEITKVKLHTVICTKCKTNLLVKPVVKVCPVCGNPLPARKE